MTTPLERVTALVAPYLRDDLLEPRPLLSLAEFLDGNDVVGSIWCNVVPDPDDPASAPTPDEARAVLAAIEERSEVTSVRVAPGMFDDPDWPFADVVVVVTDAPPEDVRSWFPSAVEPDEVDEVDVAGDDHGLVDIGEPPHRLVVCWRD
ncbi:MAG TPA: hypothetical protein VGE77_02015 [Nocardioides sp.]